MRYPIVGAALQRAAARRDMTRSHGGMRAPRRRLAWISFKIARVTGICRGPNGAVSGLETTRGFIATKKVGVVAAGHTSVVMAMADVRTPLESFPLQALVSSPVKPDHAVRCDVEHNSRVHVAIGHW